MGDELPVDWLHGQWCGLTSAPLALRMPQGATASAVTSAATRHHRPLGPRGSDREVLAVATAALPPATDGCVRVSHGPMERGGRRGWLWNVTPVCCNRSRPGNV
jgi:hypothetical protein